jgi:hypothetical protein
VCSAWRPPCRCWRCNKEIDGYRHFRSGECVLFDEAEILRWVAALSCCSDDSGKLAMLVVHGRLDGMAGRLLAGWRGVVGRVLAAGRPAWWGVGERWLADQRWWRLHWRFGEAEGF